MGFLLPDPQSPRVIAAHLGLGANHFSPRLFSWVAKAPGTESGSLCLYWASGFPKAQVHVEACPLSTPVPGDPGLSHCLRKTFTVPELLTSAIAAALVMPGAGRGACQAHLSFSLWDSFRPRSSPGRSASRLIFENHHFYIPDSGSFVFVLFEFPKT